MQTLRCIIAMLIYFAHQLSGSMYRVGQCQMPALLYKRQPVTLHTKKAAAV